MKVFRKTKELYLRPSLQNIEEIVKPMGWHIELVANDDFPYNTTEAYLIHVRPSAVLSDTICKLLDTWLYEYRYVKFNSKLAIQIFS